MYAEISLSRLNKTMKKIIISLLIMALSGCYGNRQQQTTETNIVVAVNQLIKGMTDADESILESILASELVYGHSNGRVQNKSEFIAEILSGQPFVYVSIEPLEQTIQLSGDVAVVRHIMTAETKNPNGESGSLRIGNMLVWRLQSGTWKLLARQAYRL